MNKLLVILMAGAFATVAAAQTPAPAPMAPAAPMKATAKEKQADVKGATSGNPENPSGTAGTAAEQAATVKASREVAKMSMAEKKAFAMEINKQMVNPENTSGAAATAKMQKETTMDSKGMPKANVDLKSKDGQKSLEKDLQKKSTP